MGRGEAFLGKNRAKLFELLQGLVERTGVEAHPGGHLVGTHFTRQALEELFQGVGATERRHISVLRAGEEQTGRSSVSAGELAERSEGGGEHVREVPVERN